MLLKKYCSVILALVEFTNVSKKEKLLQEIEQISDPVLEEVIDFLHFLKMKSLHEKIGLAVVSESSLKKDWLKPEEEEAWQDL